MVLLSGIGPVDLNAVGTTAGMDLKFEHDSDWSELGDKDGGEDPDSNSEGFYGNDYPEVRASNIGDHSCRYLSEQVAARAGPFVSIIQHSVLGSVISLTHKFNHECVLCALPVEPCPILDLFVPISCLATSV